MKRETIRRHHLSRIQKMKGIKIPMIQDIYPHKLHNEYNPSARVQESSPILNIFNGKVLVHTEQFDNGIVAFPMKKELPEELEYTYLFKVDNREYFLWNKELSEDSIPEGYSYVEERSIRKESKGPCEEVFAATTAKHLSDWYRDACFCGRCGTKMVPHDKERAMSCPSCGYIAYPRIMPAVIVGVKNGDKLLLTKYRTGFAHNALIAGFTEIGETAEETVMREVMEEAGIKVKNIHYYKSQPWGTANDLLLGFYCEVDGDDTITMDRHELKYAEWVQREEIVLQPGNFSLTNEMMRRFKEGYEV